MNISLMIFTMIFLLVFLVPSTLWKIRTTTAWSCKRINSRLFESNRFTDHILLSYLGPVGIIHIRSYSWKIKYSIRGKSCIAYWISRTILSNDSTNNEYTPVSWKSLSECSLELITTFDFRFSERDFDTLKRIYANNTDIQSIISKYDEEDIAAISLDVNSTSLWLMSPPSLRKLKSQLRENVTVKFRYSISVSRLTHEQSDVAVDNQVYFMHENDATRQELIKIILDGDHNQIATLPFLFPKFLKVRFWWENNRWENSIEKFIFATGYEFERFAADSTISIGYELSKCYPTSEWGQWNAMVAISRGLQWKFLPRGVIEAAVCRLQGKYCIVYIQR